MTADCLNKLRMERGLLLNESDWVVIKAQKLAHLFHQLGLNTDKNLEI